jgi:hypothetical protein
MTCDQIKSSWVHVLEGLHCKEASPGHTLVASPFMNLEGDHPEVHVLEAGDGNIVLTDFGEAFRGLTNSNIDALDSQTRTDILDRIGSLFDIRHEMGRFQIQVPPTELGDGLHRMFQALAFVEDMIFTASPRDEADFKNRVADTLTPIGGKLTRNVKMVGTSGREYFADIHLYVVRDVWIEAITAVTRGAFANQVNRTHAMWTDAEASLRRITLFDDTSPVMDDQSLAFLSNVSHVERWSAPDEFQARVRELTSATA